MLEYTMRTGHTFYLNHLLSTAVLGLFLYWVAYKFSIKSTRDKALHGGLSFLITAISLHVAYLIGVPWWTAPLLALAVGIGKEVYDKYSKKGTADAKDLLADAYGVAAATFTFVVSFLLHKK